MSLHPTSPGRLGIAVGGSFDSCAMVAHTHIVSNNAVVVSPPHKSLEVFDS